MRAEDGAIESVSLDAASLDPDYQTVGSHPARGICGSGMIDLISEMLLTGVIDQSGKFAADTTHPRIRKDTDETVYILEFADHFLRYSLRVKRPIARNRVAYRIAQVQQPL
jgi:uncharacterized 2Fe-2S/4Fe-4S cluster protein (DUF4445 family)